MGEHLARFAMLFIDERRALPMCRKPAKASLGVLEFQGFLLE